MANLIVSTKNCAIAGYTPLWYYDSEDEWEQEGEQSWFSKHSGTYYNRSSGLWNSNVAKNTYRHIRRVG